jgi:hypothetical protein
MRTQSGALSLKTSARSQSQERDLDFFLEIVCTML